jgi:DNA polymerase-3 subunit gamma/tau
LQGRADYPLAPDEYAAFTMPLLRMLAFAPEASGQPRRAVQPASVRQSASPAASKPAPVERTSAAVVAREPSAAPVVVRPPVSEAPVVATGAQNADNARNIDWTDLLSQLKLGGMARMLAQHSELASCDAGRMELRVPEAHRHLLEKPYRDKLQSAVEEHFGRRVRLEFTLGEATGNTPAERADQVRQERQRGAIAAIDRDPFVRELVENFDARVIDESIRPLEGEPAHDTAPIAKAQPEAPDSR